MNSQQIMIHTGYALMPGFLLATYIFGIGIVINVIVAIIAALILETCLQRLSQKPTSGVATSSGCLTAVLLALCLPPLLPLTYLIFGVIFALVFGKYVYGGLGQNLFNPAMVGYAALILSAPLALSQWVPVSSAVTDWQTVVAIKLQLVQADGYTGATALDLLRNRAGLTMAEYWLSAESVFVDQVLIALGYLIGGVYLLRKNIITLSLPIAMLLGLLIPSLLFYDAGSSGSMGSPVLHAFAGATVIGAFFIITDPVSSPNTQVGLLIYGVMIGLLTFLIRSFGAYPDGLAFAVLLANACGPLIDHVVRQMQSPGQLS